MQSNGTQGQRRSQIQEVFASSTCKKQMRGAYTAENNKYLAIWYAGKRLTMQLCKKQVAEDTVLSILNGK